jgi:hypothetical protein
MQNFDAHPRLSFVYSWSAQHVQMLISGGIISDNPERKAPAATRVHVKRQVLFQFSLYRAQIEFPNGLAAWRIYFFARFTGFFFAGFFAGLLATLLAARFFGAASSSIFTMGTATSARSPSPGLLRYVSIGAPESR